MLSMLLNLLWVVLGGLPMALAWWLAALICAISIVGLPWARSCWVIGCFSLWPFGSEAMNRRQLSNALCDDFGLPPVIWDNHDRPGARVFNARVSNARLREIGFRPSVSSMLEPVAA